MSRPAVVLNFILSQTSMLRQNAAKKDVKVLATGNQSYWPLNWAYSYGNIYGKISFAPLNILATVVLMIITSPSKYSRTSMA